MPQWIRRKLVKDARRWYTWASSWVLLSIPVVITLQETIPFVQEMLPNWLVAVISLLGFFARLYRQGKEEESDV